MASYRAAGFAAVYCVVIIIGLLIYGAIGLRIDWFWAYVAGSLIAAFFGYRQGWRDRSEPNNEG